MDEEHCIHSDLKVFDVALGVVVTSVLVFSYIPQVIHYFKFLSF